MFEATLLPVDEASVGVAELSSWMVMMFGMSLG
jgi:hypothetical protein